jgi:hypothetical protein
MFGDIAVYRSSAKFVTSKLRTPIGFSSLCLYLILGSCQNHDALAQTTAAIRLNSGGSAYSSSSGSWAADTSYSGGAAYAVSSSTAIGGTSDPTPYRSERWGNSAYAINVPNGNYTLRLHFAEIYFTTAGKRKFNVSAEGKQILSNYDIVADAGAPYTAIVKSFPVTISDGQLNLSLTGVVDNAKISAIELVPPVSTTSVQTNTGGGTYTDSQGKMWSADTGFTSGSTYQAQNSISGTSEPALYQNQRYGNFNYGFNVPNGSYTLKLYFSEIYFTSAGQRKFNVSAEGTQILSNYDIVADAGAANKAVIKSFPVTISDGQLDLAFTSVVNYAEVSAIELVPASTSTGSNTITQVSGNAQTGTVGSALPQSLVVKVSSGSTPKSGVSVNFSTTSGTLSTTTAITDAQGQATTNLTFGSSAGIVSVTASVAGATPFVFTESANPAAAAKLALVAASPSTQTNQAVSYQVKVQDKYSNTITSATNVVSFGVSGVSGSFSPASAAPTSGSVNSSFLPATTGTATITASASGLTSGTTSLSVLAQPTSIKAPTTKAPTTFSSSLTPYATASSLTVDQILANTSTAGVTLSSTDTNTRKAAIQMYKDFGIDLSLDYKNNFSNVLLGLEPTTWSTSTPQPLSGNFVQPFSIDAPYYHSIPTTSNRAVLPAGYINSFQYNTVKGGDGIGLGIAISSSSDPVRLIRSEWYGNVNTRKDYYDSVRSDALTFQGWNLNSDKHLSFINSTNKTVLNGYSVTLNANGVDYQTLYNPGIYSLGTLGDKGGSVASGINDLAILVRPGEATNTSQPIPHAVGGPVRRVWKARTYPALSWDAFIDGADACTATGYANTGLVPYGGVIQLDPNLVFTPVSNSTNFTTSINGQNITISLPAYRILQAMQTYGYYVLDFGCSDLDVYTNTNDSEYANYGGSYTVQTQIQSVVSKAKLYVVPPMVQK